MIQTSKKLNRCKKIGRMIMALTSQTNKVQGVIDVYGRDTVSGWVIYTKLGSSQENVGHIAASVDEFALYCNDYAVAVNERSNFEVLGS